MAREYKITTTQGDVSDVLFVHNDDTREYIKTEFTMSPLSVKELAARNQLIFSILLYLRTYSIDEFVFKKQAF